MAEEPDNLTLRMLREIRGTLEAQSNRFDQMDKRFDRLEKQGEEMRQYMTYAMGLGGVNELKAREFDQRMEVGETLNRQFEQRFKDIEKRLTGVEERID